MVTEENPHVCNVYCYMKIDEFVKIEDGTLGQFTGLYDCDGKEIYEDDIVQEIHNPVFGYIGFHQASASFRMVTKNSDIALGNRGCPTSILQVIGNFTENPNMIKNEYKTNF